MEAAEDSRVLLENLNRVVQAYTHKCLRNIEEVMKDVYIEDPADDGVRNDFLSTITSLARLRIQETLLVKSMIHSKMEPSTVKVFRDGVHGIVTLYLYSAKAIDKVDISALSEFDADEELKRIIGELDSDQESVKADASDLSDASSIIRNARDAMTAMKS